jgi:hypothetical protein
LKLSIAALAIAAGLAACSGGKATDTAKADDFTRDLQLASSTTMDLAGGKVNPALLNSLETKPQGAPQAAKTIKKGAGTRAVRSKSPTVRATPETDVAATDESSDATTVATAPVPEPTHEPVAVAPRPVPIVVQAGDATSGDYGTSGNGGGVFGGGGGIGGVVIRGGGVDGDHCEPHGGRGRTTRGPVYTSPGMGGIIIRRVDSGSRPTFPQLGVGVRIRGR